jgi:RNA polymerase sigma factor (sigma-70 family)
MTEQPLGPVVRHLRRLAHQPDASDQELLRGFLDRADQGAFETLVRRHGPMVREVCRRLLGQDADADDALQAVFLALARQARSIRTQRSLAGWLHGVAYRTAQRARRNAARRRQRERKAASHAPADPGQEASWRELCAVLDAELYRLADVDRVPLVLCYLEGRTRDEAARELGLSLRTLDRRLGRGRERLRGRLARRGLTLSAALLTIGLGQRGPCAAGEETGLWAWLARGAAAPAGDSGTSPGVTPGAAGLARQATPTTASWRLGLAIALALGAAAVGLAVVTLSRPPEQTPGKGGQASRDAKPARAVPAERPGTDLYGDPLPAGAVVRLGTVRFRHAEGVTGFAFVPGGKALIAGSHDGTLRLWEVPTGKEIRRFLGHKGAVHRLALSADGRLLASWGRTDWGEPPGRIRLWDVATGRERRQLVGPKEVESFAWSPDGKSLAVGGADGTVRLHDLSRREPVWVRPWHGKAVRSLAFSPSGDRLASGSRDGTICLADVKTPNAPRVLRGRERDFHLVAFTRGGQELVSCGDCYGPEIGSKVPSVNTVAAWDARSGRRLRDFRVGDDAATDHKGSASWALSADGTTLALGYWDHTVRLWDMASGKPLRTLTGFPDRFYPAYALAWAHDGKALAAAGSYHAVCLLDPATGRRLPPGDSAHESNPRAVALSPDGKTVATGSHDQTVILWDTATGRPRHWLRGHRSWVYTVAFAPDGRSLASGCSNGTMILWDVSSGKELRRVEVGEEFAVPKLGKVRAGRVCCLAFSPDGAVIALGVDQPGDGIRLIEAATGKERGRLAAPSMLHSGSLAFSADGKVLAAACDDGTVRRWQLSDRKELSRLLCHRGELAPTVQPSPGGDLAAVAGYDGRVRVWDVAARRLVLELRRGGEGAGHRLVFSADGRYLALCGASYGRPDLGDDLRVELWELRSGQRVWERRLPPRTGVSSAALSADGRRLVTALADTTALVWEPGAAPPAGVPARLEDCWTALAGGDATGAWRAMAALEARRAEAVAFLKRRLGKREVSREHVMRLVAGLDDRRFAVRQAAARELEKLADQAEPVLRAALAGKVPLEVRRRLEELLERLDQATSPERLRVLRALEVLERIGTPEAREVLQGLAETVGGSRLGREARVALERLARRLSPAP